MMKKITIDTQYNELPKKVIYVINLEVEMVVLMLLYRVVVVKIVVMWPIN